MFTIFGATGKVGGATVRALLERGAPVRIVVRDRSRAGEFAALGCDYGAELDSGTGLVAAAA